MPDFSRRSEAMEIMDDLHSGGEIIATTLRELEKINLLLGGNQVTIDGINQLLYGKKITEPIVIADVGCGSGDILKLIHKKLNQKNVHAKLVGIDANPNIVDYAKKHGRTFNNISFEALNIFSSEFLNRKFDIVTGTLFFHHFSNVELINFFKRLKSNVNVGIVINDIHRHWFAYYSIKWLTRLLSNSSMVIHDAPVSVLRAFKKKELIEILNEAGIRNYKIRWMWAFRWQVVIDLQF